MKNGNPNNIFGTPDLAYWWSQDVVPIWYAAILSFGNCPFVMNDTCEDGDWVYETEIADRVKMYRTRLEYATADIGKNSEHFKSSFPSTNHSGHQTFNVSLPEFRTWAISKKLEIDENFRTYGNTDSENRLGGVALYLPYENEFMSIISKIMWERYGLPAAKKEYLQKIVIDDLISMAGMDERVSKSIAAKIQPSPERHAKTRNASPSKSKNK